MSKTPNYRRLPGLLILGAFAMWVIARVALGQLGGLSRFPSVPAPADADTGSTAVKVNNGEPSGLGPNVKQRLSRFPTSKSPANSISFGATAGKAFQASTQTAHPRRIPSQARFPSPQTNTRFPPPQTTTRFPPSHNVAASYDANELAARDTREPSPVNRRPLSAATEGAVSLATPPARPATTPPASTPRASTRRATQHESTASSLRRPALNADLAREANRNSPYSHEQPGSFAQVQAMAQTPNAPNTRITGPLPVVPGAQLSAAEHVAGAGHTSKPWTTRPAQGDPLARSPQDAVHASFARSQTPAASRHKDPPGGSGRTLESARFAHQATSAFRSSPSGTPKPHPSPELLTPTPPGQPQGSSRFVVNAAERFAIPSPTPVPGAPPSGSWEGSANSPPPVAPTNADPGERTQEPGLEPRESPTLATRSGGQPYLVEASPFDVGPELHGDSANPAVNHQPPPTLRGGVEPRPPYIPESLAPSGGSQPPVRRFGERDGTQGHGLRPTGFPLASGERRRHGVPTYREPTSAWAPNSREPAVNNAPATEPVIAPTEPAIASQHVAASESQQPQVTLNEAAADPADGPPALRVPTGVMMPADGHSLMIGRNPNLSGRRIEVGTPITQFNEQGRMQLTPNVAVSKSHSVGVVNQLIQDDGSIRSAIQPQYATEVVGPDLTPVAEPFFEDVIGGGGLGYEEACCHEPHGLFHWLFGCRPWRETGLGHERVIHAPFEIATTQPMNNFRMRLDAAYDADLPDRAEFLWAKIMGARNPVADREFRTDYYDMRFMLEAGGESFSVQTEIPIRILDPVTNENTAGMGDMSVTTKTVLLDGRERWQLTQIFRTTFNTGSPSHRTGSGNIKLEPGILCRYKIQESTYAHSEITYIIPTAGDPIHSGQILRYGLGFSHVYYETDTFATIPTLEFVGWSVLTGQATTAPGVNPTVRDVDGDHIFTIHPGVRFVSDNQSDLGLWEMGLSTGLAVTNARWYQGLLRVELRLSY